MLSWLASKTMHVGTLYKITFLKLKVEEMKPRSMLHGHRPFLTIGLEENENLI